MHTERVTFLTTPGRKASLAARAAASGMSVGEYVRRKIEEEDQPSEQEEAELAALVEEVNRAIPKMNASLDSMIRSLDNTHREVDRMLRAMGART